MQCSARGGGKTDNPDFVASNFVQQCKLQCGATFLQASRWHIRTSFLSLISGSVLGGNDAPYSWPEQGQTSPRVRPLLPEVLLR